MLPLPDANPAGAEQLAQALAQALNVPLVGTPPAGSQIMAFLRSKEMLLVLDNLEEWLEARAWLSQLLAQSPDVKILVASRQRLDLQAERVYLLSGLPLPAPSDDPLTADAVALFQRRARRVQPDFTLTPAEADTAAHICRLVEGLPLGIELGAAWAGRLSCAQIATEIEHNLDFLVTDREDVPLRQRSLRAVFDWSWGRLTPTEQTAFAHLAVFHGPFAYAAAEATAAVSRQVLSALVDKSLVWRRNHLYQLHEVARRFGLEKLIQAGQLPAAQTRHAHTYAHFLAQHIQALQGANQQVGLVAIEREMQNVTAAWQWIVATQDVSNLDVATDGLYHFLAIRSLFRAGLEMFGAARRALQPLADDPTVRRVYGRMMAREGRFLSFLSCYAEAKTLLSESLEIARATADPNEIAFALNHLGGTARMEGDLAVAEEYIRASLALRRQTGDLAGQAVAWLELAGIAFMAADYITAHARCEMGLPVAETAGDLQSTAHLLTGLSLTCRELERLDDALAYGRRAQEVYEALGDRYGVIQVALTLGELSRRLARWEEARHFCNQAIQVSQEIGHRSGEADGHFRLGQVESDLGQRQEAIRTFHLALTLAQEIQETPMMLDTLLEIGWLLLSDGKVGQARTILHFLSTQPLFSQTSRARLTQGLARLGHNRQEDHATAASLSLAEMVALAAE